MSTLQRATSDQFVSAVKLHLPDQVRERFGCATAGLQRALSCPAACRTAQPKITVRRDVQYSSSPQPGTTVHFKGFASRVDFTDPHNIGMATQLMQRLKTRKPPLNKIALGGNPCITNMTSSGKQRYARDLGMASIELDVSTGSDTTFMGGQ